MTQDPRFKNAKHKAAFLQDEINDILDQLGTKKNRDLLFHLLSVCIDFAENTTDRLDIKIASSALSELQQAFQTFYPFRSTRKVTIFGSARSEDDDPNYLATVSIAKSMTKLGWMIITGAGPGIMAAGIEGAGRENSFGVNIKLPFEQGANLFIQQDPKLVEMKYFFTRKLIFIKESDAFLVLPGGFGTLDEAFELLTLIQTGKAQPAPIVFYEAAQTTYWEDWLEYVDRRLFATGLVSQADRRLFIITKDEDQALDEFSNFYRNYHSSRAVGDLLVIRMKKGPSSSELKAINRDFAKICHSGTIESIPITSAEKGEKDGLELERLALRFDRVSHGELRTLIDRLNQVSRI